MFGALIFLFIIISNNVLSSNLSYSSIISVFTFLDLSTYYSYSTINLGSSVAYYT